MIHAVLLAVFGGTRWYSWALAPFGVAGMLIVGRKNAWGWALSITTQFLWVAYALAIQQYGMILGSVLYLAVYVKNLRLWLREESERKAVAP